MSPGTLHYSLLLIDLLGDLCKLAVQLRLLVNRGLQTVLAGLDLAFNPSSTQMARFLGQTQFFLLVNLRCECGHTWMGIVLALFLEQFALSVQLLDREIENLGGHVLTIGVLRLMVGVCGVLVLEQLLDTVELSLKFGDLGILFGRALLLDLPLCQSAGSSRRRLFDVGFETLAFVNAAFEAAAAAAKVLPRAAIGAGASAA